MGNGHSNDAHIESKNDGALDIYIYYHNVLVMIKHFYKWLELVPLLDCNNEGTTYAILD
jgi:hypothetical protein